MTHGRRRQKRWVQVQVGARGALVPVFSQTCAVRTRERAGGALGVVRATAHQHHRKMPVLGGAVEDGERDRRALGLRMLVSNLRNMALSECVKVGGHAHAVHREKDAGGEACLGTCLDRLLPRQKGRGATTRRQVSIPVDK